MKLVEPIFLFMPEDACAETGRSGRRRAQGPIWGVASMLRNGWPWMAVLAAVTLTGCTSPGEYIRNRFKVGPDYSPPPAPTAEHWIDTADARLRQDQDDHARWWTVFRDPVLNSLIVDAYQQNLTLGQAGMRVLQARSQLGIAVGNIFPQQQGATGQYTAFGRSVAGMNGPFFGQRYLSQWQLGFNMAWELDFWGRFRRAVEAADARLSASVEEYDDVLVTLLGDVATNYVQARVAQEQIELVRANAELQRQILRIAEARFEAGRVSELDVDQAKSTLAQTESQIPQLEILLRRVQNRLCVLMGMPPQQLEERLGRRFIPSPPTEVVVGIPAQLLARRPDVRRAERLVAAQSEQIGIAEADLYPAISITGNLGFQALQFSQLFSSRAFTGSEGPSFQWNLLNYGRIVNNVRLQDARLQELILAYQQAVLLAAEEVEEGLVTFLKAQERARHLEESVLNAQKAVDVVIAQYKVGTVDFNRVALIAQDLVRQQDLLAQAQGQIALGLIQAYRALGGGWQIRLESEEDLAAVEPPESLEPQKRPRTPQILEQPGAAPLPPEKPADEKPAVSAGKKDGKL
ncbi:MAG: efflux transporter outer membrane subunit [Kiritimatiellia bacterium]